MHLTSWMILTHGECAHDHCLQLHTILEADYRVVQLVTSIPFYHQHCLLARTLELSAPISFKHLAHASAWKMSLSVDFNTSAISISESCMSFSQRAECGRTQVRHD